MMVIKKPHIGQKRQAGSCRIWRKLQALYTVYFFVQIFCTMSRFKRRWKEGCSGLSGAVLPMSSELQLLQFLLQRVGVSNTTSRIWIFTSAYSLGYARQFWRDWSFHMLLQPVSPLSLYGANICFGAISWYLHALGAVIAQRPHNINKRFHALLQIHFLKNVEMWCTMFPNICFVHTDSYQTSLVYICQLPSWLAISNLLSPCSN